MARRGFFSKFTSFAQSVGQSLSDDLTTTIRDTVETVIEGALKAVLTAVRPLFGPNEVAEGFSLFPDPIMSINDDQAEASSYNVPDEPYLFSLNMLDLSGTFGPSSELFSGAANLNFDRDADDDDVEQVLKEMIDGDGGAVFDEEREPGIDNVGLISIMPDSYTLSFDSGEAIDVLALEGEGTEKAIKAIAANTDLSDDANTLSLVDIDSEQSNSVTGGDEQGPFSDLISGALDTDQEVSDLLAAAIDLSDERVELLGLAEDSFSVKMTNKDTGAFDILIVEGQSAAFALQDLEAEDVNVSDDTDSFIFANTQSSEVIATGTTLATVFGADVGQELTADELLEVLANADTLSNVNAIDQGDTVRLEVTGAEGTRDVIVFATDKDVPGGAYDPDLFLFA